MKLFKTVKSLETLVGFNIIFLCICCMTYEANAAWKILFHPEFHNIYMMDYIIGFTCFITACALVIFYIKAKPTLDKLRE